MTYTDKEIMKKFGKNLKFYRNKLNITQEQLAEMCECSKQTVSGAETGYSFPSAKTLFNFSRALNVPLAYFFNFDETKELSSNESATLLEQDFKKMPEQQKEILQKIFINLGRKLCEDF